MAATDAVFAQGGLEAAGGYGSSSSSYESSSYESSTGGALGGDLGYAGAGFGGAGYGDSSYESSYSSSAGNVGGDLTVGGAVGLAGTNLSAANYSSTTQTTAVQQYETDAQGLFKDSNPQIIRRPAPGGTLTYTQNIRVRFLQPPPVPPPGVSFFLVFFSVFNLTILFILQPLIIKEVRPPQPPVPPPLRIRQQAPPLPQPPPLILRERPPAPPATVASQTGKKRKRKISYVYLLNFLSSRSTIGCSPCSTSISNHRTFTSCSS
jgi:hypothetical protein